MMNHHARGNKSVLCLVIGAAGALALSAHAQTTYFVDAESGHDVNNGESWAEAFETLQRALQAATAADDEIWVAEGTYDPLDGVTCELPEKGPTRCRAVLP